MYTINCASKSGCFSCDMGGSTIFGTIFNPFFWFNVLILLFDVNGLVPFKLSMQKPNISPSTPLQIYSFIFTVLICYNFGGMATSVDMFISKEAIGQRRTHFHVTMGLIIVSVEKSIFGYVFQQWSKHRLIGIIDEAFEISQHICATCDDTLASGCISIKSMKMFKAKVTATLLQTVILVCTGYQLQRKSFSFRLQVIMFSHWVGTMMSSMFFCGMFVVWQFYLTLNRKLKICINGVELVGQSQAHQMRMQMFCDLSDVIDRLASLYDRCLVFTKRVNSYFTLSVFVALAHAFVMVLSQLYFIYQTMAKIAIGLPDQWSVLLMQLGFISFYIIEIYFMVCVSNAVIEEGRVTGAILCSMVKGIDQRLNRSVSDLFSCILVCRLMLCTLRILLFYPIGHHI